MKFLAHIVYKQVLIVPLVLGILLIGAIAIAIFEAQSPKWINDISDTLTSTSLDGFRIRAVSTGTLAQGALAEYVVNTRIAALYARDVLRLRPTNPNALASNGTTYPTYFGTTGEGFDTPPATTASLFSRYFSPNYNTPTGLGNDNLGKSTSVLDNTLRAVFLKNPIGQLVQFGLEDTTNNGFRLYPYTPDSSNKLRTQSVCNDTTTVPSDLANNPPGYHARCRPWYTNVARGESANTNSSIIGNGVGGTFLSAPYISSNGGGKLTITGSQGLYKTDGSLYGVMSVQVSVSSLAAQITGVSRVLTNGYVYMITRDGNIIVHPNIVYSNNPAVNDIRDYEKGTTGSILDAINTSLTNSSNPVQFDKVNSGTWRVAAAGVFSTSTDTPDYIVVATAPETDITALSDEMKRSSLIFGVAGVVVIAVITVLGALISYNVTRREANKVLAPINELGEWLDRVAKQDLDGELGNSFAVTRELGIVNENFKNLLVAVRFGNQAYYANDLERALQNYEAAEKIMIKFKNERGRGVCLNNKGNVYKQMDHRFNEAVDAYSRAIEIAETLINLETDTIRKRQLTTVLANRISNLGVLYKDLDHSSQQLRSVTTTGAALQLTPNQERARQYFNRALDLHRSVDNVEGIAQTSGNLGQLLLDANDIPAATELLRDAYDLVRSSAARNADGKPDPIAMQYACMNMGYLADRSGRPAEAVTWYTYVLQRFDVVVSFVQRTCAAEIIRICEETDPANGGVNRPELARAVRQVAAPVFGDLLTRAADGQAASAPTFASRPKNVWFVLDVSGSMAGSFIRACRQSLKEIIRDHCSAADSVALTTFNNEVKQVFGLLPKTDDAMGTMLDVIERNTECWGATAFYQATMQSFTELGRIVDSGQAPGGSFLAASAKDNWVVALTDGEDNASSPGSVSGIKEAMRLHPSVGLIVITVGSLKNEATIRSILDAAPGGKKKAFMIKSEQNSDAIRQAFSKVVRVFGGNSIVENL
ncbi:hypothetical protein DFJ73DRAFT_777345 [Zopfochytrium polystomum]|nr:hypothetical protein DFJ73DRAFT_777345 [Zopfochytrium polystomum]